MGNAQAARVVELAMAALRFALLELSRERRNWNMTRASALIVVHAFQHANMELFL